MDTADTADKVATKRGRPKKQDVATPIGEYQVEQAKKARDRKKETSVVNKWYELLGQKLSLCKQAKSGTVFKTFVGSMNDTRSGAQVREFVKRLEKEGRLKVLV